jgi:hypothetical protein
MHASHRSLALLAALVLSAAARPAQAQTTGTGLVKTDFELKLEKKVGDKWVLPSDLEASLFFNKARCECDTPVAIRVAVTSTALMKQRPTQGNVKLIAGPAGCVAQDLANRPKDNVGCTKIADLSQLPDLFKGPQEVETTVGKLFAAGLPPSGQGCAATFSQSVWLWVDADRDGSPDMGIAGSDAPTLPIAIDGEAPAAPTDITVTAGNEALTAHWSRNTVMNDSNGFLVFCSRGGLPVFKSSYFSGNEYQSQRTECSDKVLAPGAAESTAFGGLDPAFLCSDLLTTASEWRIKGLQNGIPYEVGVAAVDTHGNASPIETALVQSPVPTVDFFDAYRAAGGQASGCAYGGKAPAGEAALLLLLGLAWRRRR